MKRRIRTCMSAWSAVTALLSGGTLLEAQTRTSHDELAAGHTIEREIRPDEVHRLRLKLDAGQFVYVSVVEEDIDLSVKVTGPSGRLIGWYDGGKSVHRHDPLSAVTVFAQKSGDHWLDLHPMKRDPGIRGRYTARIERLEPAAGTPSGRAEQWLSPWDIEGQPGVAVGVIRGGDPVFVRGYGEADVEHGAPITPRTVFHVASLSKQVVAFAVHLLVERGEMSLDDDIRTYLPWVPDFGTTITVRHLLHHTHGLPGEYFRLMLAGWNGHDVYLQRHVLDLVRRQEALYFEPGAEYRGDNRRRSSSTTVSTCRSPCTGTGWRCAACTTAWRTGAASPAPCARPSPPGIRSKSGSRRPGPGRSSTTSTARRATSSRRGSTARFWCSRRGRGGTGSGTGCSYSRREGRDAILPPW